MLDEHTENCLEDKFVIFSDESVITDGSTDERHVRFIDYNSPEYYEDETNRPFSSELLDNLKCFAIVRDGDISG